MTLYEKDECFASSPGQVVKGLENIRRSMQGFIDMEVKLETKVKRIFQTNDLALLITEWSINETEPDDKIINYTGRRTVVLRRQSNGIWLTVIENPWGTN